MRKFLLKFAVAAALLLCSASAFAEYSLATFYVSDYREMENDFIALDGEWDFFWGKFVDPDDLYTDPDTQVTIPSQWNYYDLNEEAHAIASTGKGSGTYRITVIGLKPNTSYGFFTYGLASTALAVYCDNDLIYKAGEAYEDWTKTKIQSYMDIATFKTDDTGCVTLSLYVSNEVYRKGGIWNSIRLMEEKSIYNWYNRKVCRMSLLIGVLLTVVLYGLLVAILRKDKANLYLAAYVFAIVVRIFSSEFPLMKHIWNDIPYSFMFRLEFFALFMAPAFYTLYVDALDKDIFGKVKAWFFCIPAVIFFIIDFFLPISITNRMVPLMQIYLFATLIVGFTFIFASMVKKKSVTSMFTMATILIIGLGCLNDVLSASSNFVFSGVKILSVSFVVYSFCQTAFLAYVQNKNQVIVSAINDDLSKSNTAFNKFVPEQMISFISDKSATDIEAGEYKMQNMGILCCDIRNFSTVKKSLKDDQVFNVLNEFFQKIVPVIKKHGGLVEKYVGDGVIALFPKGAESAIKCALEMQFRLRELREDFKVMDLPPLKAGIGVHYGNVLVGVAGDEFRISEITISDNMYILKQTEELTKSFRKGIVVTREAIKDASDSARAAGRKFEFSGVRLAASTGQLYYSVYDERTTAEL